MSDYDFDKRIVPEYTKEQVEEAEREVLNKLFFCTGVSRKKNHEGFIQLSVDCEIACADTDIELARAIAKYVHRKLCFELKRTDEYETFLLLETFRKYTTKGYWQDANYLIEKQKHENNQA